MWALHTLLLSVHCQKHLGTAVRELSTISRKLACFGAVAFACVLHAKTQVENSNPLILWLMWIMWVIWLVAHVKQLAQ